MRRSWVLLTCFLWAACNSPEVPDRYRSGAEARPRGYRVGPGRQPLPGKVEAALAKRAIFPAHIPSTAVPTYATGTRLWGPVPVGGNWDIVNFAVGQVESIKEKLVALRAGNARYAVPGSLLLPVKAPARRPRPGDAVLVSIGLTSEWGRVIRVRKGSVQVGMVWAREVVEREVPLDRVRLLPNKELVPGGPVVYRRARRWHMGQLIYQGKHQAWVIGYAGKLVTTTRGQLRAVSWKKPFRPKKRVWAPWFHHMEEAIVKKVLPHKTGYLLTFPSRPADALRNPRMVSFARITRPLE